MFSGVFGLPYRLASLLIINYIRYTFVHMKFMTIRFSQETTVHPDDSVRYIHTILPGGPDILP